MPKLKTHKGTKKVCKVHPSGTITIGHPGSRHNTGKKNASANRSKRSSATLSKTDYKRIKTII